MKKLRRLNTHAGAISAACSVLNIVLDSIDEDADGHEVELKGDRYCGLSECFGVVRNLYDEYPEDMKSEELTHLMRDFYIHLFGDRVENRYDLYAAKSAAHAVFINIYDSLSAEQGIDDRDT